MMGDMRSTDINRHNVEIMDPRSVVGGVKMSLVVVHGLTSP